MRSRQPVTVSIIYSYVPSYNSYNTKLYLIVLIAKDQGAKMFDYGTTSMILPWYTDIMYLVILYRLDIQQLCRYTLLPYQCTAGNILKFSWKEKKRRNPKDKHKMHSQKRVHSRQKPNFKRILFMLPTSSSLLLQSTTGLANINTKYIIFDIKISRRRG